ncbi:MAG: KleE stable inheritance protein [Kiritimatiellae bacterium]|nr:KleE stable inheritance protein [Kiritimatiellia bacterium]
MTIIQFPDRGGRKPPPPPAAPLVAERPKNEQNGPQNVFGKFLINVAIALFALTWPLSGWLVGIDLLFQFLRMLVFWSTPGTYAGWTFLFHCAVVIGLVKFFFSYKPD